MEPRQSLWSRWIGRPAPRIRGSHYTGIGLLVRSTAGALICLPLAGMAAGFPPSGWTPFDAAARGQIAAGKLPGAVLVIGDAHHVLLRRAWGQRSTEPHAEPMTPDTIFDLASLTKVVVTTTAILQLCEQGRIGLDAPVAHYWPAFAQAGKQAITVRQLLAHASGLPPDLDLRLGWQGSAEALRRTAATRPVAPPGSRRIYSDINFIALGELVQRVSGQPLDAYARRHIFTPLNLRDAQFRPPPALRSRIAPTQREHGVPLRGVVHDPTARRMGGIAGHAGLFGTADDLARFAQALLNRHGVLSATSIDALLQPQAPDDADDPRGIGWQLLAPFAANRDALEPGAAIGHTGYTGTAMWIDFRTQRFAVLLSNRVHPDGQGDARPLRRQVLALLSSLQAPIDAPARRTPLLAAPVATGIDVLESEAFARLAGQRVGLVTQAAAIDAHGWRTLDRLRWAPGVRLVRIFTPEHGLFGDVEGGVPSGIEPFSALPVTSLYGLRRRPDDADLRDIDTLVIDLQDVGARFYTYASTMAETMAAAARHDIHVVVLDRPDPIRADRVEGPVLDPGRRSFTGQANLPTRHGMTLGELAGWIRDDLQVREGLNVQLDVVRMTGYRRDLWFDRTRLDWVPPSPNLRTPLQATLYPGVAWIEGTNVSVGRGTDHPFEWIGAPWIDGARLQRVLQAAALAGVDFAPITFTPRSGPYGGELCSGVSIRLTDRDRLDTALLGLTLARTLHVLWPDRFALGRMAELIGTSQVMDQLMSDDDPAGIAAAWQPRLREFEEKRRDYLLY